MAYDNYNIKKVENLQNISGLSSVGTRKEKKRKQNLWKQERAKPAKQNLNDEASENQDDQHSIDYRA